MAKFTDVFSDQTKLGYKIPTSEYLSEGKFPIIDQGHGQIAGYTNLQSGVFENVPVIIFGDHTRAVKYVNTPFFLGADGVKVLKSKIKDTDYKYLFYFLQTAHIPNTGYNRHFKWLKELEIPLPPISEQRRIASLLDKVTDLIAKRRAQLEKLDLLVKSRFVEMFGDFNINSKNWPVFSFNEIAIIDSRMTTDYDKYGDYPHIGIDSIEKDTGVLKGYRTIAEDKVISGKYIFTPEHIIYSKIRPNLNKVALPDFDGLCSADAYPILPISEKCNRIFLAYNMRSQFFLNYILQFCNRTNLPKVNRKEVMGFKTPLPPIKLQDSFADFVAITNKTKFTIQQSLERLETLKKSLMQKYFEQ